MDFGRTSADRRTAVCLVRPDIAGTEAVRQAAMVRRHAVESGYACLYTVRPPADHPDPVEYGLGIAAALGVDAVFVYDLATVDDQPSRVCEMFVLGTVRPPEMWRAAVSKSVPGARPDLQTLLSVLDGLTEDAADHRVLAAGSAGAEYGRGANRNHRCVAPGSAGATT
ncbi:hypothetical protein [Nocardia wallacei]|uniref:hypothetical protein n=1 Tax=Nocardia wallacei TaxID=480035 RepID=UPI0024561F37|nr:hypothetical protein [Nocardia wallacei]